LDAKRWELGAGFLGGERRSSPQRGRAATKR
jgi:hypothetical protein